MKPLRTFRLEEFLGEWEFKVRYHLTASDAESITIEELLSPWEQTPTARAS